MIECTREPQYENQLAIQRDAYPTGAHAVITVEAFVRAFDAEVPKHHVALVDKEIMAHILSAANEVNK